MSWTLMKAKIAFPHPSRDNILLAQMGVESREPQG
jgi:hypothetical protein